MGYRRHPRFRELFRPAGSLVWWAFIAQPSGRAKRESTRQHDDRAAHAWYIERVRSGDPTQVRAENETTLADALARRRAERASIGRSAGTLHMLAIKAAALMAGIGADTLLSSLTARIIDEYVAARMLERGARAGSTVSRATVYKELSTLRGAMKLARRQRYACPNAADIMPLDLSGETRRVERALSLEEIEGIATALGKRSAAHRAIFLFLLATGATYPSELARLRREDIDLDTGRVRVRGTKTRTRDRVVPVVSFARAWLAEAAPYAPFAPWANIRRDLHAACAEAGCEPCSPNDLRRSIATLMRARGVEPSLLAAYLGHGDSRMAERVYGRLTADALAGLLDARLAETAPSAAKVRPKRKSDGRGL